MERTAVASLVVQMAAPSAEHSVILKVVSRGATLTELVKAVQMVGALVCTTVQTRVTQMAARMALE
jgi:hypothetical protein